MKIYKVSKIQTQNDSIGISSSMTVDKCKTKNHENGNFWRLRTVWVCVVSRNTLCWLSGLAPCKLMSGHAILLLNPNKVMPCVSSDVLRCKNAMLCATQDSLQSTDTPRKQREEPRIQSWLSFLDSDQRMESFEKKPSYFEMPCIFMTTMKENNGSYLFERRKWWIWSLAGVSI